MHDGTSCSPQRTLGTAPACTRTHPERLRPRRPIARLLVTSSGPLPPEPAVAGRPSGTRSQKRRKHGRPGSAASAETLWKNRKRMSVSDIRHSAGVPGLEPRLTEPESVVLPITPYPTACELLRSALGDVRKNSPGEGLRPKRIRGTAEVMPS